MKSVFLVIVLIVLINTIGAISSDEFLIGCYSYLKARSIYAAFNDSMITRMKNAHYNASIWETDENKDGLITDTNNLIDRFNKHNISSFIIDYSSSYNKEKKLVSAGVHTLSTGNYWLFEAEYDGQHSVNKHDDTDNYYFYQFDGTKRVGKSVKDKGASNRHVWRCNPNEDKAGMALNRLIYRWFPEIEGLIAKRTNTNPRFDFEFVFTYADNTPDTLYIKNNKLYLTYSIRIGKNRLNKKPP